MLACTMNDGFELGPAAPSGSGYVRPSRWRRRAALLLLCVSACTRSKADAPRNPTPTVAAARASSSGGNLANPAATPAASDAGARVTAPPAEIVARFRLAPFYVKYVDATGVPIVASAQVPDFATLEALYLVGKMVGERPDVLRAMAQNNVRLAIMAKSEMTTDIPEHSDLTPKEYWDRRARGLGATEQRPAVSAAEENLLALPGDPYRQENILIHEFAHAIDERGLVTVDPTFDGRLAAAYEHARKKGLWNGTYAAQNRMEYWAEATQSWFGCNRVNDAGARPD